jgi:hypothetical protein
MKGIYGVGEIDEIIWTSEIGRRRYVHDEEVHNVYSSPDIIRLIRPWRRRCVGHCSMPGGDDILTKVHSPNFKGLCSMRLLPNLYGIRFTTQSLTELSTS